MKLLMKNFLVKMIVMKNQDYNNGNSLNDDAMIPT